MRIHELGKELNVNSNAIIGFLNTKGYADLTPTSAIPEQMIQNVRKHFATSSDGSKSAAPKAVAVPDFINKQADAEAAEKRSSESEKKAAEDAGKSKDAAPVKKKKFSTVFNPDYAVSLKGKKKADDVKKPQAGVKKSAGEKPASKDKVPAAEKPAVKKPNPARRIPARDRIPDDELLEIQKAKEQQEADRIAAEEAAKKAQEEAQAAKEKAAQAPAEADKPAEGNAQAPKMVGRTKILGRIQPAPEPADKPKESEAVKSLREKIVKGTVNVSDLQINKSRGNNQNKNNDRSQNKRRDDRTGGNNQNKGGKFQGQGAQRGDRANAPGQNKDSRDFGRDNRNKNRNNAPAAAAPVMADSKGKGKGGRTQKGKFEKQGGDKFERFENEKALTKKQQEVKPKQEEEIKVITLPDTISLKDFADKLKMQPSALIKKLFLQGKVLTVNDILDFESAEAIALDMDIICEHEEVIDYIEELLKEEEEDESKMVKRPPVVCVMGHVDHGKTSLLDAIRNTNVIAKEAGGITQHIGAYQVTLPSGEKITFLDTPGHEAFTAMRLRGAMATDVAILVVAADDGVMPQTLEAISHARAAGIHVIVAVNKIDKPGANIDKVKQELSDQGLIPEEWGGETIFCPVSAKQAQGIEELLEMVILDTEILDLKANPNRKARGLVIEAKLDKGRGSVATLLVQKGTLKVGDYVAMGESYGRVRSMTNAEGKKVKEAGPSVPVEITGMSCVPNAGDVFVAFDSDKEAKSFAQVFIEENKKKLIAGTKSKMNLEDVFDQMKAGDVKDLEIIIKADVQGSVGALKESLEKLSNDEVNVKVIHSGVGNVNESDAILASASNAIIIAFNVSADAVARNVIEHEKVDMRSYNVIYSAIDDVELAMKGMLKPVFEEVITGHAEIRQIFKSSSTGAIAGSYITDGVVKRDSKIRLMRDDNQIYDGSVATLKRFSDEAKEVKAGFECGITLKDFQEFKEGDIMEAYEMREVPRR